MPQTLEPQTKGQKFVARVNQARARLLAERAEAQTASSRYPEKVGGVMRERSVMCGSGYGTMAPSLDAAALAARARLPGEHIEPWEAWRRFESLPETDTFEEADAADFALFHAQPVALAMQRHQGLYLVCDCDSATLQPSAWAWTEEEELC